MLSATISVKDAEIMTYIHEREAWPHFRLDQEKLAPKLAAVRHRQGRLRRRPKHELFAG
jgi:hypothetical protein